MLHQPVKVLLVEQFLRRVQELKALLQQVLLFLAHHGLLGRVIRGPTTRAPVPAACAGPAAQPTSATESGSFGGFLRRFQLGRFTRAAARGGGFVALVGEAVAAAGLVVLLLSGKGLGFRTSAPLAFALAQLRLALGAAVLR